MQDFNWGDVDGIWFVVAALDPEWHVRPIQFQRAWVSLTLTPYIREDTSQNIRTLGMGKTRYRCLAIKEVRPQIVQSHYMIKMMVRP